MHGTLLKYIISRLTIIFSHVTCISFDDSFGFLDYDVLVNCLLTCLLTVYFQMHIFQKPPDKNKITT